MTFDLSAAVFFLGELLTLRVLHSANAIFFFCFLNMFIQLQLIDRQAFKSTNDGDNLFFSVQPREIRDYFLLGEGHA